MALAFCACRDDEAERACERYVEQDSPPRCDLITQGCEDDCDPMEDRYRQLENTGCAGRLDAWTACIDRGDIRCEEFTSEAEDGTTLCPSEGDAVRVCLGL